MDGFPLCKSRFHDTSLLDWRHVPVEKKRFPEPQFWQIRWMPHDRHCRRPHGGAKTHRVSYELAIENLVRDEVQRWSREGIDSRDAVEESKATNNTKRKPPTKKIEAERKAKFQAVPSTAEYRQEQLLLKQKIKKERRANRNREAFAKAGPGNEEPPTKAGSHGARNPSLIPN